MASTLPTFTDLQNTTFNVTLLSYSIGVFGADDLTELRSFPASSDNQSAVVGNTGAGFGATYTWNNASTAADDGISVIAPSDGGTGRWIKAI